MLLWWVRTILVWFSFIPDDAMAIVSMTSETDVMHSMHLAPNALPLPKKKRIISPSLARFQWLFGVDRGTTSVQCTRIGLVGTSRQNCGDGHRDAPPQYFFAKAPWLPNQNEGHGIKCGRFYVPTPLELNQRSLPYVVMSPQVGA